MKNDNNTKKLSKRIEEQLYRYLMDEQLDLLIALQEDHRLQHYLRTKVASVAELIDKLKTEERPDYVIESLCLEELTADLRPSRFSYVSGLLEQEFEKEFNRMRACGILTYEVINLIGACEPIFLVFGFGSEAEDSNALSAAVTGMIAEYLDPKSE